MGAELHQMRAEGGDLEAELAMVPTPNLGAVAVALGSHRPAHDR
jgi:hypothetical protein